jgi:hypothetical protein
MWTLCVIMLCVLCSSVLGIRIGLRISNEISRRPGARCLLASHIGHKATQPTINHAQHNSRCHFVKPQNLHTLHVLQNFPSARVNFTVLCVCRMPP